MRYPFTQVLDKQNRYDFNYSWCIDSPLELTWNELMNYKKWLLWCDALEKIETIHSTGSIQKGNHLKSEWKGPLPYTLRFETVINEVSPYSSLAFNVTGDLLGSDSCRFLQINRSTQINFIWNVVPTKIWMRMSAPFARTIFIKNHNRIIEKAICGFSEAIEQ